MLGSSLVAAQLAASQEGLSSVSKEVININNPYYIIVLLTLRDDVLYFVLLDVVGITVPDIERGMWQILF
jgi:hypothetical protein